MRPSFPNCATRGRWTSQVSLVVDNRDSVSEDRVVWPARRGSVVSAGSTCTRSPLVWGLTDAPTRPGSRTCARQPNCQGLTASHVVSEILQASTRKRGDAYLGGGLGLRGMCGAWPCICINNEEEVSDVRGPRTKQSKHTEAFETCTSLHIMECTARAGHTPPTTGRTRCGTRRLRDAAKQASLPKTSIPAAPSGFVPNPSLRTHAAPCPAAPPLSPVFP